MFSLFNFSSIFPREGGQLTPFAPMCGRPRLERQNRHQGAFTRLAAALNLMAYPKDGGREGAMETLLSGVNSDLNYTQSNATIQ